MQLIYIVIIFIVVVSKVAKSFQGVEEKKPLEKKSEQTKKSIRDKAQYVSNKPDSEGNLKKSEQRKQESYKAKGVPTRQESDASNRKQRKQVLNESKDKGSQQPLERVKNKAKEQEMEQTTDRLSILMEMTDRTPKVEQKAMVELLEKKEEPYETIFGPCDFDEVPSGSFDTSALFEVPFDVSEFQSSIVEEILE